MREILGGVVVALGFLSVAEAAPHRLVVHSNASLEIFSIAQGPDRLLWLATSDGLYRFDGFHYDKIPGLPMISAEFVGFTSDGTLWCAGFQGLARLVHQRLEMLLNEEVRGMAVYPDQVFVSLPGHLTRVALDGSVTRLRTYARRDLTIDPTGALRAICASPPGACAIEPNHADTFRSAGLPAGYEFEEALAGSNGDLWAADSDQAVRVENGRVVERLERRRSLEMRRPSPLLAGRDGQLWFLGETIRGLTPAAEFHDRADHDRYSPYAGFEDDRRHLWIAAAGEGLVEWVPQPDWQRWFPEDFSNEPAVLSLRDRQGPIVATQKNLYRLSASQAWLPITKDERRYESFLPLDDGGFLAATRNLGLVRLSSDGSIVEKIKDLTPAVDQYREILRDRKGRVWVGSKRVLLRMEGEPASFHLRAESLPGIGPQEYQQAVDLELDTNGRPWVGYSQGIAWLDEREQWHKIPTDKPVTEVRSFTLAGDDIWVAHRRPGAFSRLQKAGDHWRVRTFSAADGYGPVDTGFLKQDSRGWIWRGSSDGVYISDGHHFAPPDWLHIDIGNGLATNEIGQYGFFEDSDGTVWISGDQGVTHFRPDPSWFEAPRTAPAPRVSRLEADGKIFLLPGALPESFSTSTKVIRMNVATLDAPAFRDYPLRYRLMPRSREWQPSRDGSLEFQGLSDGPYSLEIGYAGEGKSAVATYSFRVGSVASSAWWLWLTAPLFMGAGFVAAIRYLPWFERARFRMEKAMFLLQRRFSGATNQSPSGAMAASKDYSGETLAGRYQIGAIVSRGGFSVVYECRDIRNANARVAVKVLNRGADEQSWVRDRFAHEVASLRSVEHPGIVRVLDSWITPAGEPCLAMPFLDGPTLRSALQKNGPFPPPRVAGIVREMGAALLEVHSHGIVHRDLKPENTIVVPREDGERPVILDFGTAGLRSGEHELAATTLMAGSFHYMAPERLTGKYSAASDIFSFAVMILEMLTGKRLADLNAMFADSSFLDELESLLSARMNVDAARNVVAILAPAFDPDPRGRPAPVGPWSEKLADVLDRA